jgi:hypothetical protein
MHNLGGTEREEFGRRSFELSKQYTPQRWASVFRDGLARFRADPTA